MSEIIVRPLVANVMNCVMCTLMSFGLLITPQKFMQGGQYQKPWFQNLPENRDNRLYFLGQFMAFVMLGGCVLPTFLDPHSQFLCYQMSLVHGVNLLHTLVFLCSSVYKNAVPTELSSKSQWYFMSVVSLIWFVVTVLACVHSTDNVVDSRDTYLSKTAANIIMLAFSSMFGVMFILCPTHLLSTFWEDEDKDDNHTNRKKFMGFDLIKLSDVELWWVRCVGTAILCLNLGVLVDYNIQQPLYTAGSLFTVSTLTLLNFHQVVMRPYKSISARQICMSWVPNLLMSAGVVGVLASALLYS